MESDDARPRIHLPSAPAELQKRIDAGEAVAWSEPIDIVSYDPSEPLRYPMFLDRRVYQGSSGRVYPLPFVDRIGAEPVLRSWQAFHLENEYVRLVVLPELGGRISVGYDKTNGYDFFYRNNVIKPALVGLDGPWVSGGVEFNWPQHHRPGTFVPVDATIVQEDDGAVTVWCSAHDPMTRMKGMHGVRLHPGRSVVELAVRLHNRTSERQTFLWWANVAARVHEDYQSFFPTDVRYVADHARRAITAFPAADRPYYGVDYPARALERPGADRIDYYANIPTPTSYMVVDTEDEFFGGYDHAARAGFVHWADRRISPGKKQWTWGNAAFGHAWDDHLTDGDGPYVELMAGVYTDNQPDFSWLMPGETKTFTQCWYPIQRIGIAHQANRDAAVHIDTDGRLRVGVAVTRSIPGAVVRVTDQAGKKIIAWTRDLAPGAPMQVDAPDTGLPETELTLTVLDASGAIVIEWTPRSDAPRPEPWTATEPPPPDEIESVDELHLTGIHLAQYRHPTRSPLPYWREALRRDPGNSAVNLALAAHYCHTAEYGRALEHAEAALARLTARNANPADTEAYYRLGIVLLRLDRIEEAARAFAKAAWDGKWAAASLIESARISARRGEYARALDDVENALGLDSADSRARALRVVLLRHMGRLADADAALAETLRRDPLDTLSHVLSGRDPVGDPHTLVDAALELHSFGEHESALRLLAAAARLPRRPVGNVAPVAHYTSAYILDALGRSDEAASERAAARESDRSLAFPAGLDAHDALRAAIVADPGDAVAAALLAMLLFDLGRGRDALELWQRSIELGLEDPVVYRNAAIAVYSESSDDALAWSYLESARRLEPTDARLLYELDQLAERLGHPSEERLHRLEQNPELVLSRDDLSVGYSQLLVDVGRSAEAVELLESRMFQPWEGGEGLALAAWARARSSAGLPQIDPPASLGEAWPEVVGPQPVRADGSIDYFATSLPELLLFARRPPQD